MKNVLIAFDGYHFSEGAFKFIQHLNEQEPILVTGVFLPVVDYAEMIYTLGGLSGPMYYEDIAYEDVGIIQNNIERFKSMCVENGIEFRIHPDLEKHVISELELESRFSDLMVISSELFYENLGGGRQGDYIESVLHKSECPVILIPEYYKFPENIILTYEGNKSSVYAIKQFAYLLPQLAELKTLLVYAGSNDIPHKGYIENLAARHFPDLTIYQLDAEPKKYFNTWLQDNGNTMLVAGAYGRSMLSEMLSRSFIEETIRDHKIPIFIAHR